MAEKNIPKAEKVIQEMISYKKEFGNDTFAYQKFLKEKYGVWVSIVFDETGEMTFGFDTKSINQIFQA